ncbi:helix-turn-helix domain-containing protein [Frankia sp. AgB32]|nr:helix-turn-helix domain-containing protein [Frankia sp. AgB32]
MAQDGFSMSSPRPSGRVGRPAGPQGAPPASGWPAPVGPVSPRAASGGAVRPRGSSANAARSVGLPPAASPGTSAGAATAGAATAGAATAGAASGGGGATGPGAAQPAARPSDDDEVLTVDELVAWLRLSESTVLKLLSERAIPARKVGHQWRVRRGRVRDWLDGRE